MSQYVSFKLVRIWGQIIVLDQTIPAEVDTKYLEFMRDDKHPRLFQWEVPVRLEHHFWGNVTQYAVNDSHFCCLKELGEVRLSTELLYFTIISVKIQLLFNATR